VGKPESNLTLIALDIRGEWNLPLLKNAAELSGASLVHAASGVHGHPATFSTCSFEEALAGYDTVLACETGVKARNIYDFPSPRGRTAIVVGNEDRGIPKSALRQCSSIVTIPMYCKQLSSVNVAVSGTIALYVFSKDLARKSASSFRTARSSFDLFIRAPDDPAECGSLLRSSAAFGWKAVYLDDPARSWFTENRETVSLSRAAARREVNPIVVVNSAKVRPRMYDRVVFCSSGRSGTPLSRYRPGSFSKGILVYGMDILPEALSELPCDRIFVDVRNAAAVPRPRHECSILMSVIANQNRCRQRG